MRNDQDGGELLLDAFRDLSVDYVFCSPGSEWPPLWEALARQRRDGLDGPRYVDCGHETIAVTMAAGVTQVTGRMQTVLLHAGHGLSQGSMAIGAVGAMETPMLVMSGESETYGELPFDAGAQWYRSLSVVGGSQRLIAPLVKWAQQVPSYETLYGSVVRAGEMAQRAPKGPTYLSVSMETMTQSGTKPVRRQKVPQAPRLRPSQKDIEAVARLLADAEFPLVSVQNAGADIEAFAALVDLCEAYAVPVTEAAGAYFANFPKGSDLYLGTGIRTHLADCDLVLLVENGTPWYPPSDYPEGRPIVAIAESPLKPHLAYQRLGADTYLEGNVASTLRLLTEALRSLGPDPKMLAERRARCKARHEKWARALADEKSEAQGKSAITVPFLAETLQQVLPTNSAYVDETIVHRPGLREHLTWSEPNTYFRSPTGLGQGLGYALGIKMALPDRSVVMLIGDGTFMYNPVIPALSNANELGLPVLIVVVNNLKYAVMEELHNRFYPTSTAKQEADYYGVHLSDNAYEQAAAIVGGYARRVERPADLRGAIEEATAAVANGRSAILNVIMRDVVSFN